MHIETDVISCCGLVGIYNFPDKATATDKSKVKDLIHNAQRCVDEWGDYVGDSDEEGEDGWGVMATLASYQWPKWHDFLVEQGFKVVAQWNNPNTGNDIRMYFHSNDETKKEG